MNQYGSDYDVMLKAREWLDDGHQVLLVTVLKTWGSSPRPVGSVMIMSNQGIIHGSVSGGCVEEDLLQRYLDHQLSDAFPTRINYGVNRTEASRFGLPCGGRLELLIEQLDDVDELQQLLDAIQQQHLITRQVDLQSGEVSLQAASSQQTFEYNPHTVRKVFGVQWTLLLIGAGHLSHTVSQIALMLDYRVIVCDPRQEYAQNWQLDGTELTTLMPDEAVQYYTRNTRSAVVALTHDPKLDDMALLDALVSSAFYVGAIGSQRNCQARRDRLRQMGLTATQINRLHAPTGLAIGSHTPAEIAVSILAEITQQRNLVNHPVESPAELSAGQPLKPSVSIL
ncbi:MAG TPA: XdhC family protein [Gammaproteobacteria bacterium]